MWGLYPAAIAPEHAQVKKKLTVLGLKYMYAPSPSPAYQPPRKALLRHSEKKPLAYAVEEVFLSSAILKQILGIKTCSHGIRHTLTYYDITFVTEGEGKFSIDNQTNEAASRDVFFSKPGEIRNWDTRHIVNGYALIFEDEFLSSLFKDSLFVQHLSFFQSGKTSSKLQLPDEL